MYILWLYLYSHRHHYQLHLHQNQPVGSAGGEDGAEDKTVDVNGHVERGADEIADAADQ